MQAMLPRGGVSPWVVALVCVLGWNEFRALLRSPTLLVLTLAAALALAAIFRSAWRCPAPPACVRTRVQHKYASKH